MYAKPLPLYPCTNLPAPLALALGVGLGSNYLRHLPAASSRQFVPTGHPDVLTGCTYEEHSPDAPKIVLSARILKIFRQSTRSDLTAKKILHGMPHFYPYFASKSCRITESFLFVLPRGIMRMLMKAWPSDRQPLGERPKAEGAGAIPTKVLFLLGKANCQLTTANRQPAPCTLTT